MIISSFRCLDATMRLPLRTLRFVRHRRLGVRLMTSLASAGILALTVQVLPASAAVTFNSAWGWGINPAESNVCTATTSCLAGGQGDGPLAFSQPQAVAVDGSGNVYVADSNPESSASSDNDRIDKFSPGGTFLEGWGWGVSDGQSRFETCTSFCGRGITGGGAGQLHDPQGLAVSSSGDVYVADTYNNRIDEFSSSGSFVESWGWGVSDGQSELETCTTSCEAGIAGGGAGQLHEPQGVAVGSSGDVYVADYANNRISEFSSTGSFIEAWGWGVSDGADQFETCASSCRSGLYGGGAGQLDYPNGVAVDSSGDVYIGDTFNSRIDVFSSSGGFIEAWGWGVSDGASQLEKCTTSCQTGIYGGGAGQLWDPEGIGVDGSGDVYVADVRDNRISEFSSSGSFTRAWGWGVSDGQGHFEICTTSCQIGYADPGAGGLNAPYGLAVDGSGDVYVADIDNERVDKYTAEGAFLSGWGYQVDPGIETCTTVCQAGREGGGAGQLYYPDGVALDSSGDVYVADTYNNRIDKFSSSGSFIEAWGWGVSDGARQLETCTAACEPGLEGGGAGEFFYPQGLAVDGAGDVYVADYGNYRIDELSSSGSFVRAWGWGVSDGANQFEICTSSCRTGYVGGGAGQLDDPASVAVSGSGNVYVADGDNNRIDEFSSSGAFIQAWGWGVSDGANQPETCSASCEVGKDGGGAGELHDPGGVAINSGTVYVSDSLNNRIEEFSPSGSFIEAWGWGVSNGANQLETCTTSCESGYYGGGAGELDVAVGLGVDSSGDVYVADAHNNRIDEFSSTGGFIQAWGWGVRDGASQLETCTTSCQAGLGFGGAGELFYPEGVAADSPTQVYVADRFNNRIDSFANSEMSAALVDRLRVRRSGRTLTVSWRLAAKAGVAGFNVYAGRHRLNQRLIAVHRSRYYVFRARWTGRGRYTLQVLLRDGGRITVRA